MLTPFPVAFAPTLPLLMTGENLIIAGCYAAIGSGIAAGIWRNRATGINPVIVTISLIFYSCALGHGMHGIGMMGLPNAIAWQTGADLITVFVAARFLTYYESFDVLTRISQILAEKSKLESDNLSLEEALATLKRTQAQLIQAEKMSSLGELVAGVAHEINNPVTFIHSNVTYVEEYSQNLLKLVQLYQASTPNPAPAIEEALEDIDIDFIQEDLSKVLGSMKIGTERIRQIVLSLRNFSRMDEAECKVVDIHGGIDSTLLILQHRLKALDGRGAIQVVRHYGDLPPVECYAGQLNQVFMNILANAIDALEEQIKAAPETESRIFCITIQTSLVGVDWLKISIADNGIGMDESVRQRIFDPFFTTKAIGKGTGMGMPISYQIITEKHGGCLDCFSTIGQGTEFIIQIPLRQNLLDSKIKRALRRHRQGPSSQLRTSGMD